MDAVSLRKDEQTCGGGIIQADPQNNKAARGKLLVDRHEFGQLLGARRTPCGPKVEEDELSPKGGGIEGLTRGEIVEGEGWGQMKRGRRRATGGQPQDQKEKEGISKKRKRHRKG